MTARRARAALSGVLATLVGLAATEVVSAPGNGGPTLVTSVASRFVELYAADLKQLAVELFGTNDKPALIVGIVVVSCVFGGIAGVVALRSRLWAGVLVSAWSAVGIWAGLLDVAASEVRMVVAGVIGGLVSLGTLIVLLRYVEPTPVGTAGLNTDPTVRVGTRRQFMGLAGGAGVVAAAGYGFSRVLRDATLSGRGPDAVTLAGAAEPGVLTMPGLDVPGISPILTPNKDFYRIDTAFVVPRIDPDTWSMKITGKVDNPYELTYAEISAMDLVEVPLTIQCVSNPVGGDLVGTALWRGVPLSQILERAGVQPGADQIIGQATDGFTAGFPTAMAMDGRTALLAIGMNGEPLPEVHGFPARLVVAGIYGYVSATKWLAEIRLTGWDDEDGFWVPRGWSKEGPIKLQSRIDVPRKGEDLFAGRVPIAGVAWAPTRGIEGVEVRIDEGEWHPATLGDSSDDDVWTQWLFEWDATEGDHDIEVRAIAKDGEVQTEDKADVAPDGATGHHKRSVEVKA